jgi:hypothetical protein
MNIPSELESHIAARAEAKAKTNAQTVTGQLSAQIQKDGDLSISLAGNTVIVNGQFIEALQQAIFTASMDRLQKEEVESFLKDADTVVAERAKATTKVSTK